MSAASWRAVRDDARDRKLEFFVDVFGARSLSLARDLAVDGVKLHSTCFLMTVLSPILPHCRSG